MHRGTCGNSGVGEPAETPDGFLSPAVIGGLAGMLHSLGRVEFAPEPAAKGRAPEHAGSDRRRAKAFRACAAEGRLVRPLEGKVATGTLSGSDRAPYSP